jgi:hypothetical protein
MANSSISLIIKSLFIVLVVGQSRSGITTFYGQMPLTSLECTCYETDCGNVAILQRLVTMITPETLGYFYM